MHDSALSMKQICHDFIVGRMYSTSIFAGPVVLSRDALFLCVCRSKMADAFRGQPGIGSALGSIGDRYFPAVFDGPGACSFGQLRQDLRSDPVWPDSLTAETRLIVIPRDSVNRLLFSCWYGARVITAEQQYYLSCGPFAVRRIRRDFQAFDWLPSTS